jgi:hypothetical protein
MIEFLIGIVVCLLALAVLATIADWIDGRERRAARKRNQARPWR